jgi:hypothetical protein
MESKLFIQQWRNTSDKSFFNELKNQRKESCLICLAFIPVKRNELKNDIIPRMKEKEGMEHVDIK